MNNVLALKRIATRLGNASNSIDPPSTVKGTIKTHEHNGTTQFAGWNN
jgi:hypothetical protein